MKNFKEFKEVLEENQIVIEDHKGNKYPMGVLAIDVILTLLDEWLIENGLVIE